MDTQAEREKYQNLNQELEQVKQDLYQSTLHFKVLEATLQNLNQDIASLNKTAPDQKKLEATLFQKEKVHANLRASQTEEIIQLENQLNAKNKEFERLQSEVEFYKRKNLIEDEVALDDTVKPESILLENETLKRKCEELQLTLANIQQQRQTLHFFIQESEENLVDHQTALEIKKEELEEQTNVIEGLKCDLEKAMKELEVLKNQALPTNSRGNSMFTEIEDRRVQLEEFGTKMSSNYVHLQQSCEQQKQQTLKLHTERTELLAKIENNLTNARLNHVNEEQSLQNEIETRKTAILSSRSHLNKLPKLISKVPKRDQTKPEFLYYQEVIDSKNEEVGKHEEYLIKLTTDVCNLARTLSEALKKQKILELNKLKLQHEIEEVKECESLNEKLEICRKSVSKFSMA